VLLISAFDLSVANIYVVNYSAQVGNSLILQST
jgi:hypothetical protein